MIDAKAGLTARLAPLIDALAARPGAKLVILNKVDIADKGRLLELAARVQQALAPDEIFMVSAATGDGIAGLKRALAERMPPGPWHFPEDQVSDASERMAAAEVTREQLYLQLHAELPYASAVETEKYEERRDGSVAIHQQILVGRDTQRAIVLGKGGARLKEIGSRARAELEALMERKVHLFLHVKVRPEWEEDRSFYRDIGLDWVD